MFSNLSQATIDREVIITPVLGGPQRVLEAGQLVAVIPRPSNLAYNVLVMVNGDLYTGWSASSGITEYDHTGITPRATIPWAVAEEL